MTLYFSKIILHNFGSYRHAELDLTGRGFCSVRGENQYVKDKALSNGSGKSLIWNAICYAITGETLKGIKVGLQNIDSLSEPGEQMYTELYFSMNTDEYIIKRGAEKSTKFLTIFKNDKDISGKTYKETLAIFADTFTDLNKDLLGSAIILGQGMPNKLSSFTPAGRKALLETLTKSDFMIENLKAKTTARMDMLTKKQSEAAQNIALIDNNLERLTHEIEDLSGELSRLTTIDYNTSLSEKLKVKEKLNLEITNYNSAIENTKTCVQQLEQKKQEILGLKNKELSELTEGYNNANSKYLVEQATLNVTIKSSINEINRLDNITDICPTCHQKLKDVVKPDTSSQKQELENNKKLLENVCGLISKNNQLYTQKCDDINKKYSVNLNDLEQELSNKRAYLISQEGLAKVSQEKLVNINLEISKVQYEIENIEKNKKQLQDKIQADNEQIQTLTSSRNEQQSKIDNLLDRLSYDRKIDTALKRDFRGSLLQDIVGYLDMKAKEYSEIVYGHRNICIQIDDNNLDIIYDGKPLDILSGGECTRVDLIVQLSIRDLLQATMGLNTNILVLDEVTDFLDKLSCEAVINLIREKSANIESIFIISHMSDVLSIPIDSEILIIKSPDGVSQIVTQ